MKISYKFKKAEKVEGKPIKEFENNLVVQVEGFEKITDEEEFKAFAKCLAKELIARDMRGKTTLDLDHNEIWFEKIPGKVHQQRNDIMSCMSKAKKDYLSTKE